jgi:hypothetical protein
MKKIYKVYVVLTMEQRRKILIKQVIKVWDLKQFLENQTM